MKQPCHNCQDRTMGCHGKCERYREYKARMEVIREKRKYIAEAIDAVAQGYSRRNPYKKNKL